MGGEVKKAVDAREAAIRPQIEQLIEPRRKQAETDLRAEGQKLADQLQGTVRAKYDADITAYAQNLAKGYASGLDLSATYALPALPLGRLTLNADWSYLIRSYQLRDKPGSERAATMISIMARNTGRKKKCSESARNLSTGSVDRVAFSANDCACSTASRIA